MKYLKEDYEHAEGTKNCNFYCGFSRYISRNYNFTNR